MSRLTPTTGRMTAGHTGKASSPSTSCTAVSCATAGVRRAFLTQGTRTGYGLTRSSDHTTGCLTGGGYVTT